MDAQTQGLMQSCSSCHRSQIFWFQVSLLLLLSHFSCVRLCVTPQMSAHQASLSLGFSRQEQWSGLLFPSPMHESESESEGTQSCPTFSNPMDRSLPGSSVHGIFQARVLKQGAIAFSSLNPEAPGLTQMLILTMEEGMATHSSILPQRIPWTEEPDGLQP